MEAYNQKKITQEQAGIYILHTHVKLSFCKIAKEIRKNASFCAEEYRKADKVMQEIKLQMTLL